MGYKVQLKKLIKIVNPFEHNIFKGLNITMEDIETRINTLDIFPMPSDSEEEITIKKIAYKVANYQQGEIVIQLPEMGEVLDEILMKGSIDLCAAIYRQEEFVNVNLLATPKMAKTLLGVDLLEDQQDFELSDNSPLLFDWKVPSDLDKTWNNPEYILQRILSERSFEDGIKLHLSNIPSEIIDTVKFAEVFCQKRYILSLPPEWLYKPNFFNIVKSNNELFLHTFDMVYAEDYQEFIDNPSSLSIKTNNEKFITLTAIKNGLFNNSSFCKEIISFEKSQDSWDTILKYFNENVLFEPFFLNLCYFHNPHGYNKFHLFELKNIPKHILQNENWQNQFIQTFKDFSQLSVENLIPVVKILNDKDKIIEALKINQSLYSIYKLLPTALKDDSEVIEAFVDANSKVYLHLNSNIEHKNFYLRRFLMENPSLYNQVPFDDIVQLNDKEVFQHIVANDYHILNNKKFPKQFKEDTSVLIKAGANLKYLGDKRIEKILFKNIDIAKQLCSFDPLFYWKAPTDLKRNPEFALEQLKHNGDIEMYLFASKDFCINALKINERLADKIPDPYWNDLKFIKSIAEFVDQNEINKKVFDFAPSRVRQFIDSCNIDSDFSFFFNKVILNQKLNDDLNSIKPSKSHKI